MGSLFTMLWVVVPAFRQDPPVVHDLNYVTSTATFLMAADAPWRPRSYMLRTYLGSANTS